MSSTPAATPADAKSKTAKIGGIPWIDPSLALKVKFRKGDMVVSCPAKSGTTWTMNIMHQLRTGGDAKFTDVYVEVPWIEWIPNPVISHDELLKRWEALPTTRRRAFKTHLPPAVLPLDPNVKYIVPVRNGKDAICSFFPFLNKHTPAFFDMWKTPAAMRGMPSLDVTFDFMTKANKTNPNFTLEFLKSWWPHRFDKNVLMIHFSDMTKDHEGTIRKIAAFLDIELDKDQWAKVLEYTSFGWMKANGVKFEIPEACETGVKMLQPGGMVRTGKVGESKTLSAAQIAAYDALMAEAYTPEQAAWCDKGGPLPPLKSASK